MFVLELGRVSEETFEADALEKGAPIGPLLPV